LPKHQASRQNVVQRLFPFGEPGHEEPDATCALHFEQNMFRSPTLLSRCFTTNCRAYY
jgi:hypothetical protein